MTPRASPNPRLPALLTNLSCAYAPELLWCGEDGAAESLPLAVGTAESVIQVVRNIDQPWGARRWGLGHCGRP